MSISVLQSYRVKELTEPKVYPCGEGETLQNRLGVLLALPERQLPSHAHFQCSIERVKLSLRSKNVFLYIFTGKKSTWKGHVLTYICIDDTHLFVNSYIYNMYICIQHYALIIITIIIARQGQPFSSRKQFVTAAVELHIITHDLSI